MIFLSFTTNAHMQCTQCTDTERYSTLRIAGGRVCIPTLKVLNRKLNIKQKNILPKNNDLVTFYKKWTDNFPL